MIFFFRVTTWLPTLQIFIPGQQNKSQGKYPIHTKFDVCVITKEWRKNEFSLLTEKRESAVLLPS